MTQSLSWKEKLADKIPAELGREIDIFEQQMELRKQGKIDEKVFAETRLRRGIYGQRYDNGQRHDGKRVQKLKFREVIKGPDTFWDAPGMMRIKIPFGGITPEQLETLADLSEEYADGVIAYHHAPGRSVSLRAHRRYAGAHAPARRRRDYDARSLRQCGAQCYGLPAGGNLP